MERKEHHDPLPAGPYRLAPDTDRQGGNLRSVCLASFSLGRDGRPAHDSRIANLLLRLGDRLVNVGLCRLLNEPADAAERRCVSLGREHDFERLFSASEAVSPEPSIQDLTSILTTKERILPAFRDFVTNLAYDMNAYCTTLDRADVLSRDAPLSAREGVLENAVAQVGPRLYGYLDGQFRQMHQIIRDFSYEQHETHGLYLRCQMWNLLLRAPMVARAILKPCGSRRIPSLPA